MSKYSYPLNGVHHDHQYLKPSHAGMSNVWRFYLGDLYIGQVHYMGPRAGWAAVPGHFYGEEVHKLFPLYGFRTRYDAAIVLANAYKYLILKEPK